MENINCVIERNICIHCMYNTNSNGCKWNQYKRCTEYDKEFFDSDYFKEKYLRHKGELNNG